MYLGWKPSYKNGTCVKKLSEGATACLFHLSLQAFVASIMKSKARAGIIFHNCEKSNDGNLTPRIGDKSAIQNKYKVATKPESGQLASEASRPEFRKSRVFQSRGLNLYVLCNEIKNIVFICAEKTLALCHFYFLHMCLTVSTWTTSMTCRMASDRFIVGRPRQPVWTAS